MSGDCCTFADPREARGGTGDVRVTCMGDYEMPNRADEADPEVRCVPAGLQLEINL